MFKANIRTRLTLSHLAAIVIAMGLSGFLLLSLLERYFMQAMEENLVAQAQITAQALIPGATAIGPGAQVSVQKQLPASNTLRQQRVDNIYLETQNIAPPTGTMPLSDLNLGYLADASLGLSAQLDTHIRLLDAHGIVLIDSGQTLQGTDLQADPLVTRALSGEYASRIDQRQGNTAAVYGESAAVHVVLPVTVAGQLVGVVYLSQPLRDVTAVLRDLRTRWWLSMGIALALSGLIGLLLSEAIARPLRRLTAAAGAVAQGQFDQQVPVRSNDELGRLSRAFNDMTARLRAAHQMQISFVANVSHELRTPLTSVKGVVETLRGGAVEDRRVRDRFLETIENETDRLIRLINDLLLLSRVDSEALNLRRSPVDLAQLAQAAVDQLIALAEARQLTLTVETDPAARPAWADPDRITQVLLNLLDNAVKYARPGGRIVVLVSSGPEQTALVQVQDEGIGIAPQDLPHIGERFYRADKARSRAQGGSGLGIAIARALVQAHGGRLWLESQEGQGTKALFTLPTS